jgi:hypothetical protein
MGEIKSLEQLTLVTAFIVPGLVALFIRAQFLTGRIDSKDSLLTLFAISLVWYGISAPFVSALNVGAIAKYQQVGSWFGWIIVGPAFFGLLLGLTASKGWSRRILIKLGIRVVDVMPTAWDKTFGRLDACWVIVTLKDGSKIAGFCGAGSFASSDPKERDIYIERMYGLDEQDAWQEIAKRGVLVPSGEIRCIEFFPQQRSSN